MMKLFLIACLTGLSSLLPLWEQQREKGELNFLHNVQEMQLELDFSKASMLGLSEEKFSRYEKDWQEEKGEIYDELLSEISKRNKRLAFTKKGQPYKLRVEVREVDLRGNTICDLTFYAESKEVAIVEGIYGEGGTYGTKINLIKDGIRSIGKEVGNFIKAKCR